MTFDTLIVDLRCQTCGAWIEQHEMQVQLAGDPLGHTYRVGSRLEGGYAGGHYRVGYPEHEVVLENWDCPACRGYGWVAIEVRDDLIVAATSEVLDERTLARTSYVGSHIFFLLDDKEARLADRASPDERRVLFLEAERRHRAHLASVRTSGARDRWIRAAIVLATDPNADVACPACEEASLDVRDVLLVDSDLYERYLACPGCGQKNVMRAHTGGPAESAEGDLQWHEAFPRDRDVRCLELRDGARRVLVAEQIAKNSIFVTYDRTQAVRGLARRLHDLRVLLARA